MSLLFTISGTKYIISKQRFLSQCQKENILPCPSDQTISRLERGCENVITWMRQILYSNKCFNYFRRLWKQLKRSDICCKLDFEKFVFPAFSWTLHVVILGRDVESSRVFRRQIKNRFRNLLECTVFFEILTELRPGEIVDLEISIAKDKVQCVTYIYEFELQMSSVLIHCSFV